MEILSYLFCTALFLAPFGAGFVLGYFCMDVKCSRLRRENERFKLLMDKMFRQHMDGRRGNGQKHGKHRGTPQCNAPAPGACTPCN